MSSDTAALHHPPSTMTTRAASVGAAVVVALVHWFAIELFGGLDLRVGSGASARVLDAPRIAGSALVAAAAGWGLLALMERRLGRSARTFRAWRRVAVVVAVLSLLGPLTADAAWEVRGSLVALHATVATAFVVAMSRRSGWRPRA